jgi:hypothetical protein
MEREASEVLAEKEADVHADLLRWRAAHPQATLTEIELAVEAAVQRLRAHYLAEVVAPTPGTDPSAVPAPPPGCPHCGGVLQPRGRRTRAVLTPGQPDPVHLARPYCVCAGCGAGVFPPG